MKFGIFDHLDQRDEPVGQTLKDRLELLETAEDAGFYCYHLAEHHATPLGIGSSPSVFLAAAAEHTSRMRIGALVWVLPLHNPLRLVEEICMLDQLSNGRLDVGMGRGFSPYEIGYYGINSAEARAIFEEAVDVITKGLTCERLDHQGPRFQYHDVPMEVRPVQQPRPPMWFAVGSRETLEFAARYGMNVVGAGSVERTRPTFDAYRECWAQHRDDPERQDAPNAEPLMGIWRHLYVAESDAEAETAARIAYQFWGRSMTKLWHAHRAAPRIFVEDFDEWRKIGGVIVGSPQSVSRQIADQIDTFGGNYMIFSIAWGNLGHDRETRSVELFASDVMPAFAD